jgi:endonuclease/exonuclease/phosphatase (EEP) superfamily protein YafD
MKFIVQVLAIIVILATGVSFFNHKAWWVRIFDFPRVQIALASVVLLFAYVIVRHSVLSWFDLVLIVLLFAAFFIQAYHIVRFLRLFKVEIKGTDKKDPDIKLSILISNVQMSNRKHEKLLHQIQKYDPDMVCCLETDHWWHKQLEHLKESYHYHESIPQDNTYGMHLFSKLELHNLKVRHIIEKEVPSIHTRVEFGGQLISAGLIHPKPPAPNEAWTSKKRDQEVLIMAEEIRKTRNPYILMGDFNDVAWSDTTRYFKKVSGMLDPRIGRGFFNTYNAKYLFLRWPLDHVFVSHHFRLVKMIRLKSFGSDHFPILIELTLT